VAQVPIAEGVFTWPSEEPQLIGDRCDACGMIAFPKQGACPRCASTDVREHLLARRGRLWAFTQLYGAPGRSVDPLAVRHRA
jgi:uncharacterized OB-fold protein